MPTIISIDGTIHDPSQAKISILDRGFLYGDSVYEVLRTCEGHPFALPEHLARLRKSAHKIFLPIPWSDGDFSDEIEAALEAADHGEGESYIRIVVTRGESEEVGLDPALAPVPRRMVIIRPYPSIPAALYTKGAKVALVRMGMGPFQGIKTGNYLPNILAVREAKARGAYEAWIVDEAGRITEGANSNLFLVKGGRLITPPAVNILEGITRSKVLMLAKREQITAREREVSVTDAFAADEAFLTSTLREIMPVVEIDGRKVGDGKPGPLTERLRAALRAYAKGRAPGT
jgi:branched-chain amino acid aminotransferase